MRCPDDNAIREEWLRSRRGEPMLHAGHIAECTACRQKLAECDTLAAALLASEKPTGNHIPPEIQAAYVEKRLARHERESVQQHIANCADCREELLTLSEIAEESQAKVPFRRLSLVINGACVLAGAAAMFAIVSVLPLGPASSPSARLSGVIVSGVKGGPADAVTAMRAIEPSDADLDFAIAVWKRVVKDHPGDNAAKLKLSELEKRKARLKHSK